MPITQDEKIKSENDLQMNISCEESSPIESSSSSQILSIQSTLDDSSSSISMEDKSDILPDLSSPQMPPNINHQPVELTCIDIHRERTMSDGSSDTVDYDFDTETCATLTSESQQSEFSFSYCHDNEC
jgi:hypothetical protein